jgi:hypothetical protein
MLESMLSSIYHHNRKGKAMEDTPRDVQSELEKFKAELAKVLPSICSGGECDRRHTCKYTVWEYLSDDVILPVKSGEFCGYYTE